MISHRWTSNDETFAEFFDRLLDLPEVPREFVEQVRQRELAGRETFGNVFLSRANELEGCEEAADLALYAHLAVLRARREGRREHIDLALIAARHAALAWEALHRLRRAE